MPTTRLALRTRQLTCPGCGVHASQTEFDVWGVSRSRNQRYYDHACAESESCLFAVPMGGKPIALEPFALVLLSYCKSKAYRAHRERHGVGEDAELTWEDRYQICLDVPMDDVYALASWVRANAPEVDTKALERWLRTGSCVHGPDPAGPKVETVPDSLRPGAREREGAES